MIESDQLAFPDALNILKVICAAVSVLSLPRIADPWYLCTVLLVSQSIGMLDIALVLCKYIKTAWTVVTLQACSRVWVVGLLWYCRGDDPDRVLQLGRYVCLIWSITDSVRSLFYVFPRIASVKQARYRLFYVLYPLGVAGELACAYTAHWFVGHVCFLVYAVFSHTCTTTYTLPATGLWSTCPLHGGRHRRCTTCRLPQRV